MPILIFIIILSVLVFIHEMGHFLAAKKAGVRVDEFGIGFPPKIIDLFKRGETQFTLNWIPFGGFVKIFGENPNEENNVERSFQKVSKRWQVVILAAGVTFNFLLAWILLSLGFMTGLPYSVENKLGSQVINPELMVVNVLPGSPAFEVGLKSGDVIKSISRQSEALNNISGESVSEFISQSGEPLNLEVERGGAIQNFEITPSEKILDGRFALGISMDTVGTLRLPTHLAFWEGMKTSVSLLTETVKGIGLLIIDAVRGRADLSQVTGPVGIVGIVSDASQLGFIYILTLTAFISINLAVINLVPFPSLDGGRILFCLIEAIKGSPVHPRIFNWANTLGFAFLIFLMIAITIRDVGNLF